VADGPIASREHVERRDFRTVRQQPEIVAGIGAVEVGVEAEVLPAAFALPGDQPLDRRPRDHRERDALADIGVSADKAAIIGREAAIDPSAGGNPIPVNAAQLEHIFRAAVDGQIGAVVSAK